MGNRLSQMCNSASSAWAAIGSIMVVVRGRRGGRERDRRTRKGNSVLFEELPHPGGIRTDDSRVGDHQWLVPIADVVRVESPLLGRVRLDEEHRLGLLDDHDDGPYFVGGPAVGARVDGGAGGGGAEPRAARPPAGWAG